MAILYIYILFMQN